MGTKTARRRMAEAERTTLKTREVPTDPFGRELRTVRLDSSVITRGDDGKGDSIGFRGHAAVFNQITQIGGSWFGWREQVAPGSFKKTIGEADVRFLHNHNPDLVLARTKADTLDLSEDDTGLLTEADMARTSYGEDLAISLERGDVSQMSFAFKVVKDDWDESDEDELPLRTLREVKLYDVSTVTYPAYEGTDAGLRAVALDVLGRSLHFDGTQRKTLEELVEQIARPNEPASTTRENGQPQPGESTGNRELLALRHRANAKRFGFVA